MAAPAKEWAGYSIERKCDKGCAHLAAARIWRLAAAEEEEAPAIGTVRRSTADARSRRFTESMRENAEKAAAGAPRAEPAGTLAKEREEGRRRVQRPVHFADFI